MLQVFTVYVAMGTVVSSVLVLGILFNSRHLLYTPYTVD